MRRNGRKRRTILPGGTLLRSRRLEKFRPDNPPMSAQAPDSRENIHQLVTVQGPGAQDLLDFVRPEQAIPDLPPLRITDQIRFLTSAVGLSNGAAQLR